MRSRKIILGISGGIAAYKAPELVRRLQDAGAEVQVVLTHSAREFVAETALQAVSGLPVRSNLWDRQAEAAMGHIELARWADLVLIAPATADMMSRLACGGAGDLLTTLCLATEAQVCIAPAMNRVMWSHPAVQANRRILEQRGVRVLGPASGAQACGETGAGRMLQPHELVAAVCKTAATPSRPLADKKVMITAGPTREAIDPVRFITNRSSGKTGYALATAARDAGAEVVLISGPVDIAVPDGIECVEVESARQMQEAVHRRIAGVDIFVGAAAVADYYVADASTEKIKKSGAKMSLKLVQNPDILASVAALPRRPFVVGFAAETGRLREHAVEKLSRKKLDMIIANLVGDGRGFDVDVNSVDVFWNTGTKHFPETDKGELAARLIDLIAVRLRETLKTEAAPAKPGAVAGD